MVRITAGKKRAKKSPPVCPECGGTEVARVLHGHLTAADQRAIDDGAAVASNREEWEGLSEWYCKTCGCDWRGRWRRFKQGRSVNATGS